MAFRKELLRVAEPTRTEIGCLAIRVFESLRDPLVFAIHSEWVDEAAFELHAQLQHTVRFLGAAEELLWPIPYRDSGRKRPRESPVLAPEDKGCGCEPDRATGTLYAGGRAWRRSAASRR